MATEAEMGYRDALHQLQRHLHKRTKTLEEQLKEADPKKECEINSRLAEVMRMLDVVESLRR